MIAPPKDKEKEKAPTRETPLGRCEQCQEHGSRLHQFRQGDKGPFLCPDCVALRMIQEVLR